jgi:prepilin-type N-terminal cleavage/methylation domain-containing protein
MQNNCKDGNRGFTLLETIVAVVILTTGLLMLAHLTVVGIDMHERTESDVKAIQLAQAKMESLKSQFSQTILGGQTPYELTEGIHGPETMMIQTTEYDTQNNLYFNVAWNITNLPRGKKQVTLSVQPMNYQGEYPTDTQSDETVSITSVLAP